MASLEAHRHELQIMGDSEIALLRSWCDFTQRHNRFRVLYQIV